ncbi:hypothetical protein GCM10010885_14610 [Alicyclobacillus cellulosilyticus]|uniref:Uncharacterized protein n=1 Tax=Alicyclobacillus cellulosilyticus TaxID=1003997 RepID=A0A917NLF4_9BACL|nr:hypothetical protein GCM10010885_14610 [Alicyclobacillus cellulosilyticus]
MAGRKQPVRQVRAEKPGATGDQDVHARIPLCTRADTMARCGQDKWFMDLMQGTGGTATDK